MLLNHQTEGHVRESQEELRKDSSKAAGAVASLARCQDGETGKSGSESDPKMGQAS